MTEYHGSEPDEGWKGPPQVSEHYAHLHFSQVNAKVAELALEKPFAAVAVQL